MKKNEGEMLVRWMAEQGFTQYQLANKMGVYGSSVKYWTGCEVIPEKYRSKLIALGFDIPPIVRKDGDGTRLREYKENNKIKSKDLAEKLGIAPQQLGNYLRLERFSSDFMDKLKKAGIDLERHEPNAVVVSNETQTKRSRVVHAQAYGGYLTGYNDNNYIMNLPEQIIYIDEPGVYRTFEVKGDSMEEEFPDGCLVDAKKLEPEHWKKLIPGRVFVFLHSERGLQIKLLLKQEGSKCTFRAINPYYDDFEIDLKDVRELWYFVQKHDTNRDYSRYLMR